MLVFDANLHIVDHLKAMTRGEADTGSVTLGTVLLRKESFEHSYPHCWRCREKLIYKGVSSWFVEVTAIKRRNEEINELIREKLGGDTVGDRTIQSAFALLGIKRRG